MEIRISVVKYVPASQARITIYAPMIYTAPCKMFWMRAYPLLGKVGGGWALEFESFLFLSFGAHICSVYMNSYSGGGPYIFLCSYPFSIPVVCNIIRCHTLSGKLNADFNPAQIIFWIQSDRPYTVCAYSA